MVDIKCTHRIGYALAYLNEYSFTAYVTANVNMLMLCTWHIYVRQLCSVYILPETVTHIYICIDIFYVCSNICG